MIIDFSDRKWAEADWPKIDKLETAKSNIKAKAKSTGIKLVKKIATSEKLKDKVVGMSKVTKIGDNTYRVTADFVFNSYLFVGKHKALLIDTGLGIGSLYDMVKEITDKPLIVACTHGHFGQVGGAGQFDEVLIHKKDKRVAEVFNVLTRRVVCLTGKSGHDVDRDVRFVPFDKKELEKGIELGGRTIEIVHTPSHTAGSVIFQDKEAKIAVVGDLVTPLGIQLLPFAQPLSVYIETMEKVLAGFEGCNIYCSYWPRALNYEYAHEFKSMLYLATVCGNDLHHIIKFRKSDAKKMCMIYYGPKANKRTGKSRFEEFKTNINLF